MNRLLRCCTPVLCAGLVVTFSARAQTAPTGPPPGARAPYVPKNLKVLPQDVDIRAVMRGFTGALGVECEFCHAPADPVTHRADRASDANPMKDTARVMIRMTQDLNQKYLAQIPTRESTDPITCGTCHRGQKYPSVFVPPPRQEGNRPPGPPPATPPPGY